jgi:hypothetical protein
MSHKDAKSFIENLGLCIGEWNELNSAQGSSGSVGFLPDENAASIYAISQQLLEWLGGEVFAFNFDNSTSPLDDEVIIFDGLFSIFSEIFDLNKKRLYLLKIDDKRHEAALLLLIYFSLVFKFHIQIVSEKSTQNARVSIQDGAIYFIGGNDVIIKGEEFMEKNKITR